MIDIITSIGNEKYDYFFNDCEAFFKAKVHSRTFTDDDINAMISIDNATLLDKNTGTILAFTYS